ncbi:MAG: patatin family protein [Oleispira antarctica]|uniref:Patatin family protein n=1 Tax=Oleispira antarctica RB-8 TaxID=698738 RepID=R4YKM5_OLEAN|nr:patatin family protein [Oleispira antarctica]MBQ0790953.1 patatin family protein [Oleispira antarctica]CCK74982.1 Patatin family protein [Oleispira antarctica RB-8]|tara:strand:- start:1322 stop:2245 length:924 start_codon:yes stop_codon:yes gene_type:complete
MSYSAAKANQQNQCLPTEPMNNTALVAEGGGQRGIFTAGVLDSWLNSGFNPFDLLIGTSAGAQNLSSYITCQKGFGRHSITSLSRDPRFFKLSRTFIGKHAVDLDWYFNQVDQAENKLNIGCGEERLKKRKLLFSATKADDRKATFFEPTRDNWLNVLKASSALPILYKKGVKIDDQYYVDGGLSAPIPVEEAYKRGAKRIVVIRTLPKDAAVQSPWAHKLKSLLCNTNRCPKVLDLITHHENAYQATLDFIEQPPKDIEIIQIYPEQVLASSLVGSSQESLNNDYDVGFKAGLNFLTRYENNYAPS